MRRLFKRFKKAILPLEDMSPSGQPSVSDVCDLKTALDSEPSSSTRHLAEELGVSQQTIANKLHQFDFNHKKRHQEPYEL
ncbi:hypothetical protein KIN20_000031 [Parelaphostrongylus tenuis]|uniref:TyrR-like helix-turn-helix domain-containing protein n=1 Tax=Parelaphostrongylus tenuis TaxID=148309 RepID=A0AAD5MCN7_PARTN|nr:hypothetical protein KIN20_000031 [Parelaphostrongylus tenuis]